jgi:hypothetical protein
MLRPARWLLLLKLPSLARFSSTVFLDLTAAVCRFERSVLYDYRRSIRCMRPFVVTRVSTWPARMRSLARSTTTRPCAQQAARFHRLSSNIAFATMPSTESTNKRWLFQHPRPLSTAPPALPHSGRHRPPSGGSPFESPAPARTSPSRAGRTRAPRRGRSASERGHLFPVIADSS